MACLGKSGQAWTSLNKSGQAWTSLNKSGQNDATAFFYNADSLPMLKLTLKLLDNFLSTVFFRHKNKFEHAPLFLVSSLGEKIQVANNQGNLVLFHLKRSRE